MKKIIKRIATILFIIIWILVLIITCITFDKLEKGFEIENQKKIEQQEFQKKFKSMLNEQWELEISL